MNLNYFINYILTMFIPMEESEFVNTTDHEIFRDLSDFVYENENLDDVLYHFTLMELYNFFNKHIDMEQSITIIEEESEDDY